MSLLSPSRSVASDVRRRVVVVGIDLGTSGVKVAVREATDIKRPVAVIDFGTQVEGFSRFAVPSTIWVRGNRICWGESAETEARGGQGRALRSAKMALLRGVTRASPLLGAFGGDLPPHAAPAASEDEFALAYLLGCVIQRVYDVLRDRGYDPDHTRLLHNMDVPVDQLADDDVARRFQRTLDVAVAIASANPDSWSTEQALNAWWLGIRSWNPDEVRQEDRTNSLVAEAHAVLAGIGDTVRLEKNLPYAVIDIGAGTTDVGVFRASEWNDEDHINFFSAATSQCGCDHLDEDLANDFPGVPRERLLAEIRRVKRYLVEGGMAEIEMAGMIGSITGDRFAKAAVKLGEACNAHYVDTWRRAYGKNPDDQSWRDMRLLVVGGGALIPEIPATVAIIPYDLKRIIQRQSVLDIGGWKPCEVWGASSVPPDRTEGVLLIAARGLSYAPVQLRRLVQPDEIATLEPPARRGAATEVIPVRSEVVVARSGSGVGSGSENVDTAWGRYGNTILHFGGLAIDLRRLPDTGALQAMREYGVRWPFAVITAYNPGGRQLTDNENRKRHRALLDELTMRRLASKRVDGSSPDGSHIEVGVAIETVVAEVRDIAIRHGQSAFFWFDGHRFWIEGACVSTARIPLPVNG